MIKLNGKPYLTKEEIFSVIEKHTLSIEMASYHEVSPAIGDIPVEAADLVVQQLIEFKDAFSVHFNKEKYIKVELAVEYARRKKHDPKKLRVGTYKTGAFGIRVRADDKEASRYVFNVCMEVFSREFKELGKFT